MGSAITFTDKISSKNCQNLQPFHPLCENKGKCSSTGNQNPTGCCFHHDFHPHVQLNYCCDNQEQNELLPLLHGLELPEYYNQDQEEEEGENDNQSSEGEQEAEDVSSWRPFDWSESYNKSGNPIIRNNPPCDVIKPRLRVKLPQILGAISLNNQREEDNSNPVEDEGESTFSTCSLSKTLLCSSLFLFFLLISPLANSEVRDKMTILFSTWEELSTFSLQIVAVVLETTILLSMGQLFHGKSTRGWSSFFSALCESTNDLKQIKFGSYITPLVFLMEGILFLVFAYLTSLNLAMGKFESSSALLIGTFVMSLTLIIPYIMSTLFLLICLLTRFHFLKITEMLKVLVKKPTSTKLSSKIDSLRVLYGQLCQTVSSFEEFFKFQVLLTLCTCFITAAVGAYACIRNEGDISLEQGKEVTGTWALQQLYCAAIFIFLNLISRQLVTNAATSPGPVLTTIPLAELDEESKIQVTAFLYKISAFPTKMSAVKLIPITFLAAAVAAATNITTYLLVLMQFKLSIENRYEDDAENLTTAGFEMDGDLRPVFHNVTTPDSFLVYLTESL